ncbi:response regulator [Rufibacter roseus]|uniref:Response regulator n=1 Tax=Rufibacter roseus TaxID=1567108 RepID=A0ABW2DP53_9BACT|nr:response regulator [Rufibacter roseus]
MKKIAVISLIDDDQVYQFLTRKMIEDSGFVETILQFTDGEDAIAYLAENQQNAEKLPDLILLDLEMPFMDGWQFLDQYIKIGFAKEITIYIASSSTSLSDQEKSQQISEVKGYIVKPVTKEQFVEVVNSL